MSDILPSHLTCGLQSLILFCGRRFSKILLLPVSMIECWLSSMLSKHDKVRRSLECPVEGSIVAEHQWSQINFPISCRQFENLLQVVVNFSVCRFFLAKELWKPTSGLGIQFHRFVQLDRDFVAEFFFSIYDDFSRYSISTNPFGENSFCHSFCCSVRNGH